MIVIDLSKGRTIDNHVHQKCPLGYSHENPSPVQQKYYHWVGLRILDRLLVLVNILFAHIILQWCTWHDHHGEQNLY